MIMENNIVNMATIRTLISIPNTHRRAIIRQTHLSRGHRRGIIKAITTILMRDVTTIKKLNTIIKKHTPVLESKRINLMGLAASTSIARGAIIRSRPINESRSRTAQRRISMCGDGKNTIMNTCRTITMIRVSISNPRHRKVVQEPILKAKMLRILATADRINTIPNLTTSNILLTVPSHSKTFKRCEVINPQTR